MSATLVGGESKTVLTGIETGAICTVTETENPLYTTSGGLTQSVTIAEGLNTATVTNTRRTSDLTIVVIRNGGDAADQFTINYNCGVGRTGSVTVLGNTSTIPATGIPTGTLCTMTEVLDPRYVITPFVQQQITVSNALGDSFVEFVNTRKIASLSIEKKQVGGSSADKFDFTYTCGTSASGTSFSVGESTKVVATGLPTGTSCTITEKAHPDYNPEPSSRTVTLTIADTGSTATFTNSRKFGEIFVNNFNKGAFE